MSLTGQFPWAGLDTLAVADNVPMGYATIPSTLQKNTKSWLHWLLPMASRMQWGLWNRYAVAQKTHLISMALLVMRRSLLTLLF